MKDDTIGEIIKEANLEIYKGSFPEIREVEDEQFCSSGFYSSDQTDRMVTENLSMFLKGSSFNGSSSKKVRAKPSIDSPIPGIDSILSQIPRTKTDFCLSPNKIVSYDVRHLNAYLTDTPKEEPEIKSAPQVISDTTTGPTTENGDAKTDSASPSQRRDSRQSKLDNLTEPKAKENGGDRNNCKTHHRQSPLHVYTDPEVFSKSRKIQLNTLASPSPSEPTAEKRASPVNSILEIKLHKEGSQPRLFSKLTKTLEKSKQILIRPTDLSIEQRCIEVTPDQSAKNYSSFHSQLTNKASRFQPSSGLGSGYRSPSMKGSSSPELRIKKMLKDSRGIYHTSTIQNLQDKSEASSMLRRSEEKPKPKIGGASFNFYQVIHGQKRPNLKSPQKFFGLKN